MGGYGSESRGGFGGLSGDMGDVAGILLDL